MRLLLWLVKASIALSVSTLLIDLNLFVQGASPCSTAHIRHHTSSGVSVDCPLRSGRLTWV
jgi:hypothetical protein